MESSRTSLASRTSSRTHFEALGLEVSSSRKLPCPRLEDSSIFWTVEILLENARNHAENLRRPFFVFLKWRLPEKSFFKDLFRLKKNFKTFFLENTYACVLGPWPWPREGLSWASKFFCVLGLGLEPCVLDSTSDCYQNFFNLLKKKNIAKHSSLI